MHGKNPVLHLVSLHVLALSLRLARVSSVASCDQKHDHDMSSQVQAISGICKVGIQDIMADKAA